MIIDAKPTPPAVQHQEELPAPGSPSMKAGRSPGRGRVVSGKRAPAPLADATDRAGTGAVSSERPRPARTAQPSGPPAAYLPSSPSIAARARALGTHLQRSRRSRGWGVERVAQQAGLRRATVLAVENGSTQVLVGEVLALCAALDIALVPTVIVQSQEPAEEYAAEEAESRNPRVFPRR